MWNIKNNVKCPVCKAYLGRLVVDRACSYPCIECQWIFNFNSDGDGIAPTKMNPKKAEGCDCEGCKYRDEQALLKKIDFKKP